MQLIPETLGLSDVLKDYDRSKERSCPFKSSGCWGFKFASGLNHKIHEIFFPFWDPCVFFRSSMLAKRKSTETNTVQDVFSTFWHYLPCVFSTTYVHVCLALYFLPSLRQTVKSIDVFLFVHTLCFTQVRSATKNTCSSCQLKRNFDSTPQKNMWKKHGSLSLKQKNQYLVIQIDVFIP